jgi:hypothetical protein
MRKRAQGEETEDERSRRRDLGGDCGEEKMKRSI